MLRGAVNFHALRFAACGAPPGATRPPDSDGGRRWRPGGAQSPGNTTWMGVGERIGVGESLRLRDGES